MKWLFRDWMCCMYFAWSTSIMSWCDVPWKFGNWSKNSISLWNAFLKYELNGNGMSSCYSLQMTFVVAKLFKFIIFGISGKEVYYWIYEIFMLSIKKEWRHYRNYLAAYLAVWIFVQREVLLFFKTNTFYGIT